MTGYQSPLRADDVRRICLENGLVIPDPRWQMLEKWALFIIISGALSNIIDRIINGYVIDFIYIHISNFYWPAFNFADIYISIGILMVIINIINKFKNNN